MRAAHLMVNYHRRPRLTATPEGVTDALSTYNSVGSSLVISQFIVAGGPSGVAKSSVK